MRPRPPLLPPAYFLLALVVVPALHWLFPVVRVLPSPWNWLGAPLILAGILLGLWASQQFDRHGTSIRPFETPHHLLVEGPYRFTRNPIYLGMSLTILGAASISGNLSPFAVVILFIILMDRLFIAHEERQLEDSFGESYRQYRRRVRRWI